MFDILDRRERRIRRTLAHLSRQRLAMRLPHPIPGHNPVWVIEMTPTQTEDVKDDLLTGLLRGWVEVVEDSVPSSQLMPDGSLPAGALLQDRETMYRLTDGGWSVVRGTHTLALSGMLVAIISLVVAIVALIAQVRG
jgi:hypothetical protein